MTDAITELQLENASSDADTLAHVVNDPASPGIVVSRTGRSLKTLARVAAEAGAITYGLDVFIQNFGASGQTPDNATAWDSAIAAAQTALGGGGDLLIPWVAGSNNIYYFTEFTSANWAGLTIDVTFGVVLSFGTGFEIAGSDFELRVLRPTRVYFRDMNVYYTLLPKGNFETSNPGPESGSLYLGEGDVERSIYYPVDCSTDVIVPYKIAWPDGDTLEEDAFNAPNTSARQFQVISATEDSKFHVGLKNVVPGECVNASFTSISAGFDICGMVHTDGGNYYIHCGVGVEPNTCAFGYKKTGQDAVDASLEYVMRSTHASYGAGHSLWEIQILSKSRFSIRFNGYDIEQFDTGERILQAGFGGYPTSGSGGGSAVINNLTYAYGKNLSMGGSMTAIAVFGDSQTADSRGAWPRYMRKHLDRAFGARNWRLDNFAVPGQDSSAQLAIMIDPTQFNPANYDTIMIMIGTNNIQGGTGTAFQYQADLISMFTFLKTTNKKNIIFGLPIMYYTRAQSGVAQGQNSTNYEQGSFHRSTAIRLCAEYNIPVVDTLSLLGPIISQYITPQGGLDFTSSGDPVVCDNIHPTEASRETLGRAFAGTFISLYRPFSTYATLCKSEVLSNKELGNISVLSGIANFNSGEANRNGNSLGSNGLSLARNGDVVFDLATLGASTDDKRMRFVLAGADGSLSLQLVNDAYDTPVTFMRWARTGNTPGNVYLNLPTADPHSAGSLWNNAGIVTVSAG